MEQAIAEPNTGPPTVSVVVPAYNPGSRLAATIESVRAQTFGDWEIVVVDDCSPEDVRAALGSFADDPRLRLVRHDTNGGPSAARNTGVAHARGRFVAFLDADDSWHPEKLTRQVAAVMARPDPDRVFCVTRTIVNLADDRHIVRPVRGKRPDEAMDEFIFVSGNFCQTSAFFLSRALARRIGWRDLVTGEDHLFAIDAIAAGAEYLLVEESLTTYNNDVRPGRLSHTTTLERGRRFMEQVRGVLSQKALAGYESRYLGVMLLRQHPVQGLQTLVRAVATGALPPRFAATLLVRTAVPAGLYHRVRSRLMGRPAKRA
jgi:glycosyltransferase involved in cell wall biosynthesis